MPIPHLSDGLRRILALTVLFCLLFVSGALAGPINAKSAILMDVTTGRILYEQRADMKIPPASLTKVMTLNFSYNSVTALPAFSSDSELVTIDGSYNQLEKLDALEGLKMLNKSTEDWHSYSSAVEKVIRSGLAPSAV